MSAHQRLFCLTKESVFQLVDFMSFTDNEFSFPPSSFKKREEETFEDYTAVTPWEKFTQSLENILSRWELKADGDPNVNQCLLSLSTWTLSGYICGRLNFADREFQLVYYKGIESHSAADGKVCHSVSTDLFPQSEQVFPGHVVPPLAWFGLSHVLVLRPSEGTLKGGTRLHMLLSSVEMAMHSVRCPLPILIEYCGPYSSYFYGLATVAPLSSDTTAAQNQSVYETSRLTGALNVDFSIGQLRSSVNPLCTHLTGLREMFLEKLGYPSTIEVHISARFIYSVPFWPEPKDFPTAPLPSFSFDMTAASSAYPLFHLSAVWPKIPSHAVTQKPSWMTLRPEGSSEWYLQMFLQTSHADRLSSRLKQFCRTCRDSDVGEVNRSSTALPSRLAWLGADLPRLRSLFHGRTPVSFEPPMPKVDPVESALTGEHVIHYLLFLFPDADANFSCASSLAEELRQPMSNRHTHSELLAWSRVRNRTSSHISSLAAHLGLPPATGLAHRLGVLLCNLHFLQSPPHTLNFVQILYNEVCMELRLRLDRLICLPGSQVYKDSENTTSSTHNLSATSPSDCGLPGFSQWSDRDRCNLHGVFERFNTCIEQARVLRASVDRISSQSVDTGDKEDDSEDSFFDAVEDLSRIKVDDGGDDVETTSSAVDDPTEEARSILQWLQSLNYVQFLRLMMPSVCLETLITFYSIQLHNRIHDQYSRSLADLVNCLHGLFARFSEERTQLDGYSGYEELFTYTFCEALTVLASFSSRLNCFQELLSDFTLYVSPFVSEESLSFLYNLSMNAVCGLTEWTAHCAGWIPVDRSSTSFIDFQRLCGSRTETPSGSSTESTIEQFHFTSSAKSWFPRNPPLDMRQPMRETYLFRSILGQPNPSASRPGPHRLYVELNNESNSSQYDSLLLAGAFSHDTQFF